MVWIYGGGLIAGEANDYNASKLVTQGDVIVVTFNYRLGAFGFFAQPAIDAEHHLVNNCGLMDQQFALLWGRKSRSQREASSSTGLPLASSAAANSRFWRWNSGVSQVP
jgi:para-nitrobenzyl esterase